MFTVKNTPILKHNHIPNIKMKLSASIIAGCVPL